MACALGPAGIVRDKREGDGGTPAGRFRLLWGYYRPDRPRPPAGGVPLRALRRDSGWCENPLSPRYNNPVCLPAGDCTDRLWREDAVYDLTFVLEPQFHLPAPGPRQRDLFPHRASRLEADGGLRCDLRRRHAAARSAPGQRREDADRRGAAGGAVERGLTSQSTGSRNCPCW